MVAPAPFLTFKWEDGLLTITVNNPPPCWTLQLAYSPGGPWFDEGNGVAGQPIQVRPRDEGGAQYFRVVERPCPVGVPIEDPQPDSQTS